jgi:glutathione S-transferase
MDSHNAVAAVTLLALLVYFWMGIQVAGARRTSGISAPAMTGDPKLERTVRAHENTLEWLPIFLVSLWLFALYWNDMVATALGLVWIVGRILYALGYAEDAGKRSTGFLIQMVAASVLLLGALGRAVWNLVQGGAI